MEACPRCGAVYETGSTECPTCGLLLSDQPTGLFELLLRPKVSDGLGSEWQLQSDEVVIGRGHSVDIDLQHDSVSRRHARFLRAHSGFLLEDLQSRNWTRLNGSRVTSPVVVKHGDVVRFGDVELAVELRRSTVVAHPVQYTEPLLSRGETMLVDVGRRLAGRAATDAVRLCTEWKAGLALVQLAHQHRGGRAERLDRPSALVTQLGVGRQQRCAQWVQAVHLIEGPFVV